MIEEDDCMGDELSIDVSQDSLMIIPGMLPEPYWDFNMVQDHLSYSPTKKMLNLACKTGLKASEEKWLIKTLHLDKEQVFHINMTP